MKAVISRAHSKGHHISVCAAINQVHGVMHYEVVVSGYNGGRFASFISDLLKHQAFHSRSYTIVMNSCTAHHSSQIRPLIEEEQPVKRFLRNNPPYSPQLNAVEYCFASWAAYVNRHEKSEDNLRTLIKEAAESTTRDKIEGYVRHINRTLMLCAAGEPLRYPMPH